MSTNNRILWVDCQTAGIAGDMITAALIDAGADQTRVLASMELVGELLPQWKKFSVEIGETTRRGIRAKKISFETPRTTSVTGEKLLELAKECLNMIDLSEKAKNFVMGCVTDLIVAESRIHGETADKIQLHETGSPETLSEIVGVATALDSLKLFDPDVKTCSTPVAVGGGLFKFSHGTMSSPAPATLEILRSKSFPMIGGPVEAELATPTGVAILTNLTHETTRFHPCITPEKVGHGAGEKDFKEIPNILRVILAKSPEQNLFLEELVMLETNLDDVTGEVLGYTMEKLFSKGAKDVTIVPVVAKKGRPGQTLRVLSDKGDAERLAKLVVEETGTLGVRLHPCWRWALPRQTRDVKLPLGRAGENLVVKTKIAWDKKRDIVQIKPEYDNLVKIARKTGKPLRQLLEIVKKEVSDMFGGEDGEQV